jgi:hypothetical protein
MNIFVTDTKQNEAVKHLDDKRIVKMVLETGQIICTVCHLREWFKTKIPYKPTHINHPIVQWAKKSKNLMWTVDYFISIFFEFRYRFDRIHQTEKSMEKLVNGLIYSLDWQVIPDNFCNCAANESLKIDYTKISPVTRAYKKYLNHRWNTDKIKPKWTKRPEPEFYKPMGE